MIFSQFGLTDIVSCGKAANDLVKWKQIFLVLYSIDVCSNLTGSVKCCFLKT
jgi:hypothetical protein